MPPPIEGLTEPQRRWLYKLKRSTRLRLELGLKSGIPRNTAAVLVAKGLAVIRWEKVFPAGKRAANSSEREYVFPVLGK